MPRKRQQHETNIRYWTLTRSVDFGSCLVTSPSSLAWDFGPVSGTLVLPSARRSNPPEQIARGWARPPVTVALWQCAASPQTAERLAPARRGASSYEHLQLRQPWSFQRTDPKKHHFAESASIHCHCSWQSHPPTRANIPREPQQHTRSTGATRQCSQHHHEILAGQEEAQQKTTRSVTIPMLPSLRPEKLFNAAARSPALQICFFHTGFVWKIGSKPPSHFPIQNPHGALYPNMAWCKRAPAMLLPKARPMECHADKATA